MLKVRKARLQDHYYLNLLLTCDILLICVVLRLLYCLCSRFFKNQLVHKILMCHLGLFFLKWKISITRPAYHSYDVCILGCSQIKVKNFAKIYNKVIFCVFGSHPIRSPGLIIWVTSEAAFDWTRFHGLCFPLANMHLRILMLLSSNQHSLYLWWCRYLCSCTDPSSGSNFLFLSSSSSSCWSFLIVCV